MDNGLGTLQARPFVEDSNHSTPVSLHPFPLWSDKNKNSLYDDSSRVQVSGAFGPYSSGHKLIPEGRAGPLGYSIAQLINSSKVFSTSFSETGSWAPGSKRTRVVRCRCGQNTGNQGCPPLGRQAGGQLFSQELGVGRAAFPGANSPDTCAESALPRNCSTT